MLFGTLITLLVFLVLFIHHSNKKIQQQVALIKIASQQIASQNLATPISTETRIKEFNTSLHAMEELRQSLKSSLSKKWNIQEQRKKDIVSLSHDIKTPLTAILGNTELLLEDDITLEQQDLLRGIYHAAIRTKSYVDVLQKTNQEEDFNQEKIDVTLQQIVEDVNQSLSPLVYSKEITLNYNYHPQKTVRCFDSLLTRALINIGENAIRHTSLGIVSFTITQDNNQTTFTVSDEGVGFSKEALTHATSMFWQQDKSRNQHYGIGLALVSHVATLHRGSLKLSNTNTGACVSQVIPNTDQKL